MYFVSQSYGMTHKSIGKGIFIVYALKFKPFLGSAEIFALFKVKIDETPQKKIWNIYGKMDEFCRKKVF